MQLDKQVMIDSFRNISFYGERRGKEDFEYYSNLLKEDLEALGENQGNYEKKFIDKVMTIYHRQSNCASAFIVGPARFNNRRAEKRWDSRDKAIEDFNHWRNKYFKAVNRKRTLSPEAEIDVAIARLELLETAKETGEPKVYNVTTKIRETKKKIEVMKNRIEAKQNFGVKKFDGGSIFIENDRVVIAHDEKPEREIIDQIKKRGFRYSPKFKNWCRKHTRAARLDAQYLLENIFGGESC